jgi:hypothetical protein
VRFDWTEAEIEGIYNLPLPELIFRAQVAHRKYHKNDEVQGCVLLSVKTGGCPEDCAYCPQSAATTPAWRPKGFARCPGNPVPLPPMPGAQGATSFLHGRRMAGRAGRIRDSITCWRWFAVSALSDWRPVAPSAC